MSSDRWIECPDCEGGEGYADDDDVWHECLTCLGEGGGIVSEDET